MFLSIKTKLAFTSVQHEYFYITGRKYATNFKDKSIEKIIVISLKEIYINYLVPISFLSEHS